MCRNEDYELGGLTQPRCSPKVLGTNTQSPRADGLCGLSEGSEDIPGAPGPLFIGLRPVPASVVRDLCPCMSVLSSSYKNPISGARLPPSLHLIYKDPVSRQSRESEGTQMTWELLDQLEFAVMCVCKGVSPGEGLQTYRN